MNRRVQWAAALALSTAGAVSWVTARASSHREAPLVSVAGDGELGDLTDFYAWMTPDGSRLNLVVGWAPGASAATRFSDAVQWVFHVASKASIGATEEKEVQVICTFDVAQTVSCWGGGEYVTGRANVKSGIASDGGRLRVFAGLRNDPFFFNGAGFRAATRQLGAALGGVSDAAGCPTVDAATSAKVIDQLGHGDSGAAPADQFATQNVLALVIQVDKSLVTPGGPIVGVWASTHRK